MHGHGNEPGKFRSKSGPFFCPDHFEEGEASPTLYQGILGTELTEWSVQAGVRHPAASSLYRFACGTWSRVHWIDSAPPDSNTQHQVRGTGLKPTWAAQCWSGTSNTLFSATHVRSSYRLQSLMGSFCILGNEISQLPAMEADTSHAWE